MPSSTPRKLNKLTRTTHNEHIPVKFYKTHLHTHQLFESSVFDIYIANMTKSGTVHCIIILRKIVEALLSAKNV